MPRKESREWLRLGQTLDMIVSLANTAVDLGFVGGDTKELDRALELIEPKIYRARQMIRPERKKP